MFDGMTLCLPMANCAFHLAGMVHKNRFLLKTCPSIPASSARPSLPSVIQSEGNESFPESRSSGLSSSLMGGGSSSFALPHATTVGVIGGVSSLSTLNFLEKLVSWSQIDGQECPPFLVCSDTAIYKEITSRGRVSFPYSRPLKNHGRIDAALVIENLRQRRVFLEQSGAHCIVMPCHLSHAWYSEVSHGCSVPFLHIGECVAKELKEANLKPVETGSNVRIGVLALEPTLSAGFYQEILQKQGFEVVVPDEATMEHTIIPAVEALNRKDIEGARNLLRIALQVLLVKAVNTIILASDDMRGLLPLNDPLLKKCTDPMDALARSTLQWAKSKTPQ